MGKINLPAFLKEAAERRASDIYFIVGCPIALFIDGKVVYVGDRLSDADTESIVRDLYRMASRSGAERVFTSGDDSFSFSLPGIAHLCVSMLRQRSSFGAVIRMMPFSVPSPSELNIPDEIMELCGIENGLVLVTGLAQSGRTTTLASMLDRINRTRSGKLIVTLENPVEYVLRHANCIVAQREVYTDTASYEDALDALRYQRAHVLMLSDLPTPDVAQRVLNIAQSGVMVLSTFHGSSASNALQNLLDMFPEERQTVFRVRLSSALKAILFQRLVPSVEGTLLPVYELVRMEDELRLLLTEGDISRLADAIAASKTRSVIPFDRSLAALFRAKRISYDTAIQHAMNKDRIRRQLY